MSKRSELLKFPSRAKILRIRAGRAGLVLATANQESIEYQKAKADFLLYVDYMENRQKRRKPKIPT